MTVLWTGKHSTEGAWRMVSYLEKGLPGCLPLAMRPDLGPVI
jgi:hypothetical protein